MTWKLKWSVKLPLFLVLFATLPVSVVAYWTLELLQSDHHKSTMQKVEGLARARSSAIAQFTEDRRSEVERIAQFLSAQVVASLVAGEAVTEAKTEASGAQGEQEEPLPKLKDAEALEGEEEEPKKPHGAEVTSDDVATKAPEQLESAVVTLSSKRFKEANDQLRQQLGLLLWDQKKFEEFLIIGATGEVLVSTFQEHEGTTAEQLEYFQNGLGATFVQPAFLSPITKRLTMVISTPIRDQDAQVVAVLAARLNLTKFYEMINDLTGLNETGETVVGALVDDKLRLMAPTRHVPNVEEAWKLSMNTKSSLPLQQASRGQSGSGQVTDYRGECVYAAWEQIPSLDWAVAVKIDCSEALIPARETRGQMTSLILVVGTVALIFAFLVAQALIVPLGSLRKAAEKISKGDLDVRLKIPAGDEVGDLADSFERMVSAIKFFRENSRSEEEEIAAEAALQRAEETPSRDPPDGDRGP